MGKPITSRTIANAAAMGMEATDRLARYPLPRLCWPARSLSRFSCTLSAHREGDCMTRWFVYLFENFEPKMGMFMSDAFGGVNGRILNETMAKGSAAIVIPHPKLDNRVALGAVAVAETRSR